jgi:hypothetical protein
MFMKRLSILLGRELILHDARANVILDRIPNAIRCYDVVN